jgi:hypothetical protein
MSDEVKPIPEEVEATPEVVTPPVEQKTSSKFKISSDVILPSTGETITLRKLKAGKYYEAQKVYVEWIEELTQIFSANENSLKKAVDENGVVDEEELAKQLKGDDNKKIVSKTLQCANRAATSRMELLSICLDKTQEDINIDYYPEDIELLLNEAILLNNFLDNVKKSVAPSVGRPKKTA